MSLSADKLISVLATVTLVEMMLTLGLGVTLSDVTRVARDRALVLRAMLANYVVVPAVAILLLLLFAAQPMVSVGLLVVAVCPGAPYGPPFASLAKGDVRLAVGLMIVLAASSALLAPVLLKALLPIVVKGKTVGVPVMKMIITLAVSQFLPLCGGLYLRQRHLSSAERLKKPLGRLSTLLNLALIAIVVSVHFQMLAQIRARAYLGMVALLGTMVLAGWISGRPRGDDQKTMAITTAVRNAGVGLVIVSSGFAGTPAVSTATAYALFQTLLMALVAMGWGRLAAARAGRERHLNPPASTSLSGQI